MIANAFTLPRRGEFVWLACIGMAILADQLFYGYPWGVNAAIFSGVLVAALVIRAPGLFKSWLGRTWVLLFTLLLFALIEEPSPLAVIMAIVGIGTLALLAP